MLQVATAASDASALMAVRGELDFAGAVTLRGRMLEVLSAHRPTHLDIELAGVAFIDCAGVRTLVWADTRMRERGGSMAVIRPSPVVLRLLRLLEFDRVLTLRQLSSTNITRLSAEMN
jgi:anti-anti-sigma factor